MQPPLAAALLFLARVSGGNKQPISPIFIVGFMVLFVGIVLAITVSKNAAAEAKKKEEAQAAADREAANQAAAVRRREQILAKYSDPIIAEQIANGTVWVGETAEQLQDCLGSPLDVDVKLLKTKRREIWKYFQKGVNRYGMKITLENGIVVGWDEKM